MESQLTMTEKAQSLDKLLIQRMVDACAMIDLTDQFLKECDEIEQQLGQQKASHQTLNVEDEELLCASWQSNDSSKLPNVISLDSPDSQKSVEE